MAVKNPTQWKAPSGTGFFAQSGGASITTLSGSTLTTLSGTSLLTDIEVYSPKHTTGWTNTAKGKEKWTPGYAVLVGTEIFTDNSANFLVTNSGNNIVTTTTYQVNKKSTAWAATGV